MIKRSMIKAVQIFVVLLVAGLFFKQIVFAQNSKIFYNSEEYNKIINNKSSIARVIKECYPEGGLEKEVISVEKACQKIERYKNVKKSNIGICDADCNYTFEFNDGSKVKIYFEGYLLHYKGQNYEPKN